MAIMTRWRIPPDSLDAHVGRRDAHPLQHVDGGGAGGPGAEAAVAHQGLADLVADGEARIERGHRLLEDHGQPVAAQIEHLPLGQCAELAALEHDGAGDVGSGPGQKPHDGERGDALAAARLADDAERPAGLDGEADAADGLGAAAAIALEDDAQIGDR
jgi:hypothetical protein